MAIEIVDFPINSMVIFHSYVSLPEGIWCNIGIIVEIIDWKKMKKKWKIYEL